MPRLRSVVATGRRMKGSDGIMGGTAPWRRRRSWRVLRPAEAGRAHRACPLRPRRAPPCDAALETIEVEVDHRRREEREELREDQPADDGDTEGPAQLGARTGRE